MACQTVTETVTETEQGHESNTTAEVTQICGNVHGFAGTGNSRGRASSCPVEPSQHSQSGNRRNTKPPKPEPSTPEPHDDVHLENAPRPTSPMRCFIGDPCVGSSSSSQLPNPRQPIPPKMISPPAFPKPPSHSPNPNPYQQQTGEASGLRDDWERGLAEHRVKIEREKERRAVDSAAAWSNFTGTTQHSVSQAQRFVEQRPFTPQCTHAQPPQNQCQYQDSPHHAEQMRQQNHFEQQRRLEIEQQQQQHQQSAQQTYPACHPNYTGNQWRQQGNLWDCARQQCTRVAKSLNPFASTFASENPFCRACMMSELQQNPQSEYPYDFSQHMQQHSPPMPQGNSGVNQFNLDGPNSSEFHPGDIPHAQLPVSQFPFVQQCVQQNQAPAAATFGNYGIGQSHGVQIDRSASNEFRPAEAHGSSENNPYAVGHSFLPPGVSSATADQLFSPFANPRPMQLTPPHAHAFAPPSIPTDNWQGNSNSPPVPGQVDYRDFMPTMAEDWEARGESGKFFGLQHETAFNQRFAGIQSAPAAFNPGFVPTSSHQYCGGGQAGGMFGDGWGEDAGDNEAVQQQALSEAFQSPVQSSVVPRPAFLTQYPTPFRPVPKQNQRPFVQQCFHECRPCNEQSFGMPPTGPPAPPNNGGYGHPQFPGPPPNMGHSNPILLPPRNTGCFQGHGPSGDPEFPGQQGGKGNWFQGPPPEYPGNQGGNGNWFQGPPPQGPFGPPQNGQPGNNGPRNTGGKRWLPPPAFTPGASQSPTFRQWLWSLAAWSRLTSMPWSDRGLAVALSVGGRARSIATSMPHDVLGRDTGLSVLLQRLENDLGSELQDRTKSAANQFLKYRRARGASASDHILSFEQSYQQAFDHGLVLSVPMLSMMLLETCGLSSTQEEWVMGSVGGNYSEYNLIRRALKRLPSLGQASTFPVFNESPSEHSEWPAYDQSAHNQHQAWPIQSQIQDYNPFDNNGGGLQPPPYVDEPEWESVVGSDDYCSTGTGDEMENMLVQQAWVQLRRVKKSFNRSKGKGQGKGGKTRRKGKGKRKGTFMVEDGTSYPVNVRNASTEIPQGWEASKWLARVPCEGCGSRYHRDCRQGKGSMSGKGGGKASSSSGKRSGFATFFLTAATLLSHASSMFCKPCVELNDTCETTYMSSIHKPLFSLNEGLNDANNNHSDNICHSLAYTVPVVPMHHYQAFMIAHADEYSEFLKASDSSQSFVGLEPYGSEIRQLRFDSFVASTKTRYALMLDSGAPHSCTGSTWMTRYLDAMQIQDQARWTEFHASLSGIGSGSASVRWKVSTPIGIHEFGPAEWSTQILEGCGEHVPALLGLQPMTELNGVIDFRDLCFTVDNPQKQRCKLQCVHVSGHLMLPIDWGGTACNTTREAFLRDPLGISLWYGKDEPMQNPVESNAGFDAPNSTPVPTTTDETTSSVHKSLPCFPCLSPGYNPNHVFENLPCFPCLSEPETEKRSSTSLPCFPCLSQTVCEPPPGLPHAIHTVLPTSGQDDSSQKLKTSELNAKDVSKTVHYTTSVVDQGINSSFYAFMNRTHAFMSKLARKEKLMVNATYRRKYQSLPADSPIPVVPISPGKWVFWELWAGCGRLTSAMLRLGHTCGPPITKEKGWDLSLPSHQKEIMRLYHIHKPEIIFAAPTCGPWSRSSTNMDPGIKDLLREEQVEAFRFYNNLVREQFNAGRFHEMEQPRSSELLHQPTCLDINLKYGGTDKVTCMCPHGLKDVDSQKPYMKQTTLRGSTKLRRSIRWCSCIERHELMQGYTKSGLLRTATAQEYTKLFCTRLAADFDDHLKAHNRTLACFEEFDQCAFPGEPNPSHRPRDPQLGAESDEEQLRVTADPYSSPMTPEEVSQEADRIEAQSRLARANRPAPVNPSFLEPTAKILPRPKNPVSPAAIVPAPTAIVPANASDQPPARERAVEVDGLPVAPELVEQQLELSVKKPVLNEDRVVLANVASTGVQLANGGQRTFQTGPKIRLLQEVFGTPSGRTIRLVILTKKAQMISVPEPLVSRALLSHFLHISQESSDVGWTNHGWREISELTSVPRGLSRRPLWSIVIFALQSDPGDLAQHLQSTPMESIEERAELDKVNTSSLPAVLKVLVNGDQPEQLRMLLMLHKRLQHKRADELRKILNQSGVPGRVLAMLDDAVSLCDQCRRWQVPHSSPATKGNITNRFNGLVYGDLIFVSDPAMILLVMIDDCIRFTVVRNVSYRDFTSLTECVRQGWFSWFGPPETFRTDSESAFAHDSFGIWCEAVGMKRDLIIAKDSHSMLGPLDRKIKIIRLAAPRIIDSLLQDSIRLSADDLAAELQYNLNCQLSYGGMTAYACLFGSNPREFWSDESSTISQDDTRLPFYEMMHVRQRSIAAFHLALLRFRLERSIKSRARTDLKQLYTVGQNVDIFLKGAKKDQEGWRGPAVVLGFLGEGRVTIRWQSVLRDLPLNLIRPHINVLNTTALRQIKADAAEEVQIIAAAPLAEEPASSSTSRQIVKRVVPLPAEIAHVVHNDDLVTGRNMFEVFFNTDAADQLRGVFLDSLVSLASVLQPGNQQIHAIDAMSAQHSWSRDAIRDQYGVFTLGSKFASEFEVKNYCGIVFQSGRRFMSPMPGIARLHAIAWVDPNFMRIIRVHGQQHIDWVKEGIATVENLHLLRAIVLLEARKELPVLQSILESAPQPMEGDQPEGRIRNEEWQDEDIIVPHEPDQDHFDPGPSISERDHNESESSFLSRQLKGEFHEDFIAYNRGEHLRNTTWLSSHPRPTDIYLPVFTTEKASSSTSGDYECYLIFADVNGHSCPLYFPLNKDAREMTDAECLEFAPDVRVAQLKELSAWVKLQAGSPQKISEYKAETGLIPVTSRWVKTFKRKAGKRIIKMRLVMKGFKETRQHKLITSSPTATRTSHRVVKTTSASRAWELWSLDISAAFLRGFSFEELALQGHERQSCAFSVPPGMFELMAELDSVWAAAAKEPHLYCFRLHRAVYGLKDAPLLWFLKIRKFMIEKAGLTQSKHDSCLFISEAPKHLQNDKLVFGRLDMMLSLHVDDNLVTGQPHKLQKLYEMLLEAFEEISIEKNHFRHFGLDVWRDPLLFNVYSCQKDYLSQLEPIVLPSGRTKKDEPAGPLLITAYRSLVAGIAWTGVTYAASLTAGSLFQTFLPTPCLAHCLQLNEVLAQLKLHYRPMIYRCDIQLPLRLISLVDSSLGNNSKYSQGGFFTLLCNRSQEYICGACNQIAFKSSKSKRVASSTSHAETLASMTGLEETSFIQTWLLELQFPHMSSAELINAESSLLVPITAIGDCKDAFDMFTKPAFPTPVNRALTLYVHAIREYYEKKKVEAFVWLDTRDNISNALTKFSQSGLLELDDLIEFYTTASWEPRFPFRWHSEELCDPEPLVRTVFKSPPPPTKVMADRAVQISTEDPSDVYRQGSAKEELNEDASA